MKAFRAAEVDDAIMRHPVILSSVMLSQSSGGTLGLMELQCWIIGRRLATSSADKKGHRIFHNDPQARQHQLLISIEIRLQKNLDWRG